MLFGGQSVSWFGDHLYFFCVMWWTLTETGSVSAMSGVMISLALPQFFLGPWVGVLVDRFDRKRLLATTVFLYACISSLVGLLMLTDKLNVPLLYGLSLLLSSLDQVHLVILHSALPSLVTGKDLSRANGFMETSQGIVGLAAPAAGGLLITTLPIGILPLANAATFLFFLVALLFIRQPFGGHPFPGNSIFQGFSEGFSYIRTNRAVLSLLVALAFCAFAGSPMGALVPAAIKQDLGLGAAEAGLASSVFAAGALAAGVVFGGKPTSNELRLFIIAVVAAGGANIGIGLAGNLGILLVFVFLAGMATVSALILSRTVLQKQVPDEFLGRVFSFRMALNAPFRSVGILATGVLADAFGPQNAILVAATALLLAGALARSPSLKKPPEDVRPQRPFPADFNQRKK